MQALVQFLFYLMICTIESVLVNVSLKFFIFIFIDFRDLGEDSTQFNNFILFLNSVVCYLFLYAFYIMALTS